MSEQPNPLVLPNIVSQILYNINDVSCLENFRLINHCWNHEACSLLRKQKSICFKSEEKLQEYNDTFANNVECYGAFPHSQYNLSFQYNAKNRREPDWLSPAVIFFIENFGENITNLDITIRKRNFEPAVLNAIFSKTPNLTRLGLNINYYNTNGDNCNYEFSPETVANLRSVHTLTVQVEGIEYSEDTSAYSLLTLLFENMLNLQRISYPGDIRRISKVGLLLRDIVLDLDNKLIPKLAEWEFKTRLLEEDALKMLCKDFPMRMLHVDLWSPDDDFGCLSSDLMSGLLRKWSETLEQLTIEFPWRKEVSFHFHFPLTMRNVSLLYLGGFEGSLLELLRKLPSLKRLELSQLDLNSILQNPDECDIFSSVKQLKLDFCTTQTGGILSRFSRIFPNLGSLNINHTTNDAARVIFQKMTQLTRLLMHGNDLTDAGMCGFSEYNLKEKNFLALTPTQGNALRKYPFIADLKKLQYLKLDAYDVSEITVRHGLVHCTSLRLVQMDSTGSSSTCDPTTATVCRTFKLSEYGQHLVEEGNQAVVDMKEEPPLDEETIAFFQSHRDNDYNDDLVNL